MNEWLRSVLADLSRRRQQRIATQNRLALHLRIAPIGDPCWKYTPSEGQTRDAFYQERAAHIVEVLGL